MIDKITTAMHAANFNPDAIDLPLLVGALAQIKHWAESEPHLLALGKKSLCDSMRSSGNKLLEGKTDAEKERDK